MRNLNNIVILITNPICNNKYLKWTAEFMAPVFITLIVCLAVTPVYQQIRYEAETQQALAQLKAEIASKNAQEAARQDAEAKVMREFNYLRLTLFCEAERGNENDMKAIADNVFSRMDSPSYPKTVEGVVTEVRTDASTGNRVPMYSYIVTDCARHPYKVGWSWKLAGRMAAIALKERWEGKPSSGNVNYHAPYVHPTWASAGVRDCKLQQASTPGTFHLFYKEVADRDDCREAQTVALVIKTMPRHVPVPLPRPQRRVAAHQDEIKNLITASN